MTSETIYHVYLITYSGNKLPPFYIGSTSDKKIKDGYLGSVSSKKYSKIWKKETKENKHLFKIHIVCQFYSRKEALEKEATLQRKLKVVKSGMYVNQSVAAKDGCFGRDVSGKLNPRYGVKWTPEQRLNQSEISKHGHKIGVLKPRPPMIGSANGRYGSKTSTFKTEDGTVVYTSKDDPRVVSGELVGISKGMKLPNMGLTKRKNPDIKKFLYFILEDEDKNIIELSSFEYVQWFTSMKLKTCDLIKFPEKYHKGYRLKEYKINPECKVVQPIKKPKYKGITLKSQTDEIIDLDHTYLEFFRFNKLNTNKLYSGEINKGYRIIEFKHWT